MLRHQRRTDAFVPLAEYLHRTALSHGSADTSRVSPRYNNAFCDCRRKLLLHLVLLNMTPQTIKTSAAIRQTNFTSRFLKMNGGRMSAGQLKRSNEQLVRSELEVGRGTSSRNFTVWCERVSWPTRQDKMEFFTSLCDKVSTTFMGHHRRHVKIIWKEPQKLTRELYSSHFTSWIGQILCASAVMFTKRRTPFRYKPKGS